METITILVFTLTQSSLFFIMMFLGWFIYLLLDFSTMNKATPTIPLHEVARLYLRLNALEMAASVIMLVVLAMLQNFNQLEQFLNMIGLKFQSVESVPLGFALILGMNVKVVTVLIRKIKTPVNINETSLRDNSGGNIINGKPEEKDTPNG